MNRRAALMGMLGTMIAPNVLLMAPARAKSVSAAQRWGILIDLSRCASGCTACVDACRTEHGWGDHGHGDADPQWIRKVDASDPKTGRSFSLPVMCQHCASPPCADVCPTGATFKRADGIVLVNRHDCIGCRYCVMACPFGARAFVPEDLTDQRSWTPRGKGTAEGCNLCVHRVDDGRIPACVEACGAETGAMLFGDLNDPNSAISKAVAQFPSTRLRGDLELDNSVRYRGL